MMLKVVVSQRVDWVEKRGEPRDVLDQRLVEWLLQVGALTFPVPNLLHTQGKLVRWLDEISPQAVVLSGGNNIGDCAERDETETVLLDYSAKNNLPVLGICRGMQIMAVAAGAKLERVEQHVGARHTLTRDPDYKDRLPSEVNSFHEWRLVSCPANFRIIAKSLDGTIEAIEHETRSWQGWMWHPEREITFSAVDIQSAKILLGK